eukprot:m.125805 g.125805  ORF g.125805 m.125805 type:complete len:302 (-) comp17341_c0_seq1:70-975(-)
MSESITAARPRKRRCVRQPIFRGSPRDYKPTSAAESPQKHKTSEALSESSVPMKLIPAGVKLKRVACCWGECSEWFDGNILLARHMKDEHLGTASGNTCLWRGCKFENELQRRKTWLHGHIKTHTGIKPEVCPMGGCCKAFSTAQELARHMQSHFTDTPASKSSGSGRSVKNKESAPLEKPLPKDFVTSLREKLIHIKTRGVDPSAQTIRFVGKGLARRHKARTLDQYEELVHWEPEGVLADEWLDMAALGDVEITTESTTHTTYSKEVTLCHRIASLSGTNVPNVVRETVAMSAARVQNS